MRAAPSIEAPLSAGSLQSFRGHRTFTIRTPHTAAATQLTYVNSVAKHERASPPCLEPQEPPMAHARIAKLPILHVPSAVPEVGLKLFMLGVFALTAVLLWGVVGP